MPFAVPFVFNQITLGAQAFPPLGLYRYSPQPLFLMVKSKALEVRRKPWPGVGKASLES